MSERQSLGLGARQRASRKAFRSPPTNTHPINAPSLLALIDNLKLDL